jgi:hypothetical protein
MIDLGFVKPGETIYLPWATFAGSTGAPSAMTNLAVGDIKIYKDGSTTERASTSGFTLLDTDGQDFDALTGVNGVSIDLADNTTAGFYAAGSRYFVVISDVTVDSQTLRFVWGTFRIGLPAATLNTTIASLSSQTSFTLTSGPAEDDALNGCVVYIHDVASAVQGGFAVVSDYTGSTKTVTLTAGTTFTAAATDNIMVMAPDNARWIASTLQAVPGASGGLFIAGTNAATSVTTALTANVIGNVTGNVSGSVGSVTASVNVGQLAGQTVTAAAGVTFPTSVASPTNITAGTITTVTNLTNAPTSGDLTATMKASVNAEVLDVLNTDTFAEPAQGAPGATITLAAKIGYLYKFLRNKVTQTSSTFSVYADDASTVDHKATVSDDGTTFTRGEIATGP